jgi:signal transduction histidine kinase
MELHIRSGANEGAVFPLVKEVTTIGRGMDNDIVLNDAACSRAHAEIIQQGGIFFLKDLGSTHGTWLNEERCGDETPFHENDVARIGNTELVARTEPLASRVAETGFTLAGGETIAFGLPTDTSETGVGLSAHHLAMLSRVAEKTQSVFDLRELLNTLMDMLFEVFKPDRGVLLLSEGEEEELVPRIVRPLGDRSFYSHTVVQHAIRERMSLLVGDLTEDDRFSAAQSIMAQSIQSAICAPLVSQNTVHGVVYLDARNRVMSYQKEDLSLLKIIAANAGIAIANATLVQERVETERLAAVGVAVAGISHYVKNILTGVKGTSQLVEMGLKSDNMKVVGEAWPIMMRSMQKITVLVQDMLLYSKRRQPVLEKGNLNAVARDVHENQKKRAEEMGVLLRLELDEALPDSLFEEKSITDTVLNLVGNAIEATHGSPDARVDIVTKGRADRGLVIMTIRDNGPGIPEDIHKKIFEPFFSTKGSKGTGLGLAVARKSVEEHGGQLPLESLPGQGATFKIILPIEPKTRNQDSDTHP